MRGPPLNLDTREVTRQVGCGSSPAEGSERDRSLDPSQSGLGGWKRGGSGSGVGAGRPALHRAALFVGARAPERLSAKKSWIAFTLRPRGDVLLDAGAARAVLAKGKSVLSVGVLGVRGEFRAGDAVRLIDAEGRELARGLARCTATEAAAAAGKARGDLPPALAQLAVIVHADKRGVGGHAR